MSSLIQTRLSEIANLLPTLGQIAPQIEAASRLTAEVLRSGHRVLACGNGGSAADASHLVTELACRFCADRRPLPAVSLNENGALMTAIVNDYSVAQIFARQVLAIGSPGDLLIAFTTSGKSPNIVEALKAARSAGLKSLAFLGRDGGACRGLADVDVLVPWTQTPRIQEGHQIILHLLCERVEEELGLATYS